MAKTAPKRAPRRARNNPAAKSAAELYREFRGREANRVLEYADRFTRPTETADLGRLLELSVLTGEREVTPLQFYGTTVRVTAATTNQIYFQGGDQKIPPGLLGAEDLARDHAWLGPVVQIVYFSTKGFHDFAPTEYYHDFGEESGAVPYLAYDVQAQQLYLIGGRYRIEPRGIVD